MNLYQHVGRRLMYIAALMALLVISGCSGITPDGNLRNNREEGPEKGLFTGSKGEFVIIAPTPENEKKVEEKSEAAKSTE